MTADKCYEEKTRMLSFTVKGIRKKWCLDVEMTREPSYYHIGRMFVCFLFHPRCRILLWLWTAWLSSTSHALSGVREHKHVSRFVSSQLISSDADGAIQRAGRFRVENGSSDEVQAANTGRAHSLVSWKWYLSAAKANKWCLFQRNIPTHCTNACVHEMWGYSKREALIIQNKH